MKHNSNDRRIVSSFSDVPHSFFISHYGAIAQNTDFSLATGFHVKNTSDTAITILAKTSSMDALLATTVAPYAWSEERFDFVKANVSVKLQYGY